MNISIFFPFKEDDAPALIFFHGIEKKVADAQVVFALDAGGKATGLTLTQGGQVLPAKKIR